MDTIFALASARGKAGVAVVRISGPDAFLAIAVFGCAPTEPRRAALRLLSVGGQVLDQALVLTFGAPGSFTGEDVVELHLHGSIAVVNTVLRVLSGIEGFRLAEPGEFTRRALENERLDLTRVEGLSDLIEAETDAQRQQAMRVFSGALGTRTDSWRKDLIRAAALIEATIDFSDDDVPVDVVPEVHVLTERVRLEIDCEIRGFSAAERIREGFEVAIVGRPNVGKSTLLNALAGRDAAITSDVAGTTRDVIEVRMDLRGLPVTVLDTAGLRVSEDTVEVLGIERARERAAGSDLCVILVEHRGQEPPIEPRQDDIVLVSKADLAEGDISALTGAGVDALIDRIARVLENRATGAGVAVRERHRAAMMRANSSLGIALDRLSARPDLAEMVAEDLRDAIRALDSLVGRVDVEHILDEIFSRFCIGK